MCVRPNSDLRAICISCDLVAISHASSWFMWVRVMNAKSTRDRSEIHTRYKVVPRSLRGLTDAKICFIAVQTHHELSQTAQVVARSDLTCATLPRPSSSTCESRSREDVTTSCVQIPAGYGKRCSIGCVSACSTLIPALSSLQPSTYIHQLQVADAASPSRGCHVSDGTR